VQHDVTDRPPVAPGRAAPALVVEAADDRLELGVLLGEGAHDLVHRAAR
jgi:hypothetical protein